MKRIRKPKEKESVKAFKSHIFDTKEKVIGICAAGIIILLLMVILMVIESGYGKLIVKNKSDLNLEYVNTSFVNEEGSFIDYAETGSINANSDYTMALEPAELLYTGANIEVSFKFEGYDEFFTDTGYFADNFNGNIKISFVQTEDPNLITLKIKASNGVFNTNTVDCNESYTINLSEHRIYE